MSATVQQPRLVIDVLRGLRLIAAEPSYGGSWVFSFGGDPADDDVWSLDTRYSPWTLLTNDGVAASDRDQDAGAVAASFDPLLAEPITIRDTRVEPRLGYLILEFTDGALLHIRPALPRRNPRRGQVLWELLSNSRPGLAWMGDSRFVPVHSDEPLSQDVADRAQGSNPPG